MRFLTIGLWAIGFLFSLGNLHAQSSEKVTLRVGDDAPALYSFKWIKGDAVNEFRQGRMYIIEFGATWCAPCAAAIPELTQLAQELSDTATVVSMFVMEDFRDGNLQMPAYISRVERYVKKRGDAMDYVVGVDGPKRETELAWLKAAGKIGIPHMFIVDGDGKIAWIGSGMGELRKAIEEITASVPTAKSNSDIVKPALSGSLFAKIKSLVDSAKQDAFFLSMLTTYKIGDEKRTGIGSPYFVDNYRWAKPGSDVAQKQGKILVAGESLRRLYYMAYGDTLWNYPPMMNPSTGEYPDTIRWPHQRRSYGKYWNGLLLEINDSSVFDADFRTGRHRFNYLLRVPKGMGTSAFMQKRLQSDLKASFGYDVVVESRMMPYWRLVTTRRGRRLLRSKHTDGQYKVYVDKEGNVRFENADVRDLIFQLEIRYGYGPHGDLVRRPGLQPPFIDETGITTKIDFMFRADFRQAMEKHREEGKHYPFEQYREMLRTMGFDLIRGYKQMKVVVIREPDGSS